MILETGCIRFGFFISIIDKRAVQVNNWPDRFAAGEVSLYINSAVNNIKNYDQRKAGEG
jgi:hypothetical protein